MRVSPCLSPNNHPDTLPSCLPFFVSRGKFFTVVEKWKSGEKRGKTSLEVLCLAVSRTQKEREREGTRGGAGRGTIGKGPAAWRDMRFYRVELCVCLCAQPAGPVYTHTERNTSLGSRGGGVESDPL